MRLLSKFLLAFLFCVNLFDCYSKTIADEYFETEQYYKALEYYEKSPESYENTLGILKCKFELKKYDNLEYNINQFVNKIKQQNNPIFEQAQMLYLKYLVNTSSNDMALTMLKQYQTKDKFLLAEKYNLIGLVYLNENKFELSDSNFNQAIQYLSTSKERKYILKQGLVYNNKAVSFFYQNDFETAKKYYEKALDLYKQFPDAARGKIAKSKYNLAIIYIEKNDNYKALELLEGSLKISQQIYGEVHSMVAECYAMLGSVYLNFNQLDKALDYFNKDKNISTKIYGDEHLNVAYSYFDCGMVYNQLNDFYLAKQNLEKALSIRLQFLDENNEDIAENYLELSNSYIGLHLHENAKKLCIKILEIDKQIQSKPSLRTAEVYMKLGVLDMAQNKLQSAEQYFKQSLAIFSDLSGKNNKYKQEILLYMSEIYLLQKKYNQALQYAQLSTPKNQKNIDEKLLSNLQEYKIKYQINTTNYNWYSVLQTLKEDLNNFAKKDNFYFGEKSTLSKSEIIAQVCHFATELSFNMFQKTKDSKYANIAFFFIETNKANTLLQKQNFLQYTDKESLKILNNINIKNTALVQLKLEKNYDKNKCIALENELFELKNKFEQHLSENSAKKYVNNIDIKYIQKKLNKKELYISYLININNIYRISISKNQVSFSMIKNSKKIENIINQYNNSIQTKNHNKVIAHTLYKVLLPNYLMKDRDNIIISSDASLHQLSFDALIDNNKKYLIEKYIIQYVFSAHTYFSKQNKTKKSNGVLAFAPNYNQIDYEFLQNEEEVSYLQQYKNAKILLKQHACKDNFFKYAQNYPIIHFATHTQLDTFIPIQSSIVLSNNSNPKKYALLELKEIMQFPLHAKLVVISACEGAFGKSNLGEGVLNFAWAFRYAGANNIIISHWKSSDKATLQMMKELYAYIKNNTSYVHSLRNAKLDYLKNSDAIGAEPYFWANYNIFSSRETHSAYYTFIGLAILFIFVLFCIKFF